MYLFGGDWQTTVDICGQVMSSAGVISNVHLELGTAPGGTAQWTVTLMVNEVASALTFTITGTATTGSDTTHSVSFSAGDVLAWRAVNTVGTPASALFRDWYFELAPTTAGVSQFGNIRGSWNNTAKVGAPGCLIGGGIVSGGDEYRFQHVVPTAGTFIASYGYQVGAGTTATGFVIMLNKNGVDQDGTGGTVDTRVSWNFQSVKSVSGGTYSLPVVAGDLVYVKFTAVGTPNTKTVSFCISFKATNTSEYILGSNLGDNQLGTGIGITAYTPMMCGIASGVPTFSASELALAIYPTRPMNITKMYIWLQNAPNAGQSRSFTLRKTSADQSLTCTIADTAFAANDTANGHKVSYSSGDTLALKETSITSAAASSRGTYSLVTDFPGGGKGAGGGNSGNKKGGGGALNIQTAGGAGMIQFGNPGLDIGITS